VGLVGVIAMGGYEMTRIESYAVATRTGKRPRHVRHVQKDGANSALCGKGPVRFVGEVGQPYGEGWPFCDRCAGLAGPSVMATWLGPFE